MAEAAIEAHVIFLLLLRNISRRLSASFVLCVVVKGSRGNREFF